MADKSEAAVETVQNRSAVRISTLDRNIRRIIATHSTRGLGIPIVTLSGLMHKQHGFQISMYPEGSWRAYFLARPTLYEFNPPGSYAKARFKP